MDLKSSFSRGSLPAHDGRSIPYIFEYAAAGPLKGVFVLFHGLGVDKDEYLGFYRTLAAMLAREGYDVLRIDFPAHGESTADAKSFTLVNSVADAIAACSFALEQSEAKSLNVFGTSYGAGPAIAAASVFEASVERVTLLAPAISYGELYVVPSYPQRKKFDGFYRRAVLEGESVAVGGRVALTWRNAIEFALCDLDNELAIIASRTAVVHGDADSLVPVQLSELIAKRFPSVDLTVVRGMDHGFMDYDDEAGTSDASQRNLRLIFSRATR